MHSSRICIVPRHMSRISDGAGRAVLITMLVISGLLGSACDIRQELDGRNGNRKGNRLFQGMQFIDAASEYERALKQLSEGDGAIVHYNLGLTYSKLYRPGYEKPILLGESTDPVCQDVPRTKQTQARVCVKKPGEKEDADRRRFNECDDKNPCPSSFECKQTTMCALTSPELADLAATHLQIWIKAQPSDAELDRDLGKVRKDLKDAQEVHEKRMAKYAPDAADSRNAEIQRNKAVMDELNKRVDQFTLKYDMRELLTQAWLDTSQFDKALTFWEAELAAKQADPKATNIMGNIAGIHLKANNWKKAIEWYQKAAAAEKGEERIDQKVAWLNSIGNVAWSKLNSKSLDINESIYLADHGIGALQEAASLRPKLTKLHSLQAVIMQFRSTTHGTSFASAIDRANMQDLQRLTRVLIDEAKKQQQQGQAGTPSAPAPTPVPTPAPTTPSPAPTQPAPASPSTSAGPAPKTGG